MECDIAREALSARLDDEDAAAVDVTPGDVDTHLAGCVACTAWYRRAAHLDRLVRVAPADEPGPDPSGAVLSQVVLPRRGRWRLPLAAALIAVAIAQLTIGMSSLFTPPWGLPTGMATSQHMEHESAAFNLAFGVVLLLVGLNTRRAATQVPVLASFVGVLAAASVFDLVDGAVDWARLATHLPVVVGLVLTLALSRQPHAPSGPARAVTTTPVAAIDRPTVRSWPRRAGSDADRGEQDQPPAARRDVA